MKLVRIAPFAFAIAILIIGCSENKPVNVAAPVNKPVAPAPAATIDELASGQKVFETNCTICHKADGTGGKVTVEGKSLNVEDLTAEKIKAFTDEKIISYIIKGIPSEGMPSFKDKLSEGEMRDVVKYIRKEFHKQ